MRARYTCISILVVTRAPRLAAAQEGVAEPQPTDAVTETPASPEEAALPPSVDPAKPPTRGKGAVWGVVRSTRGSETLLEALVTVIGRRDYATTDVEGRYRLELPPGTYQIRVQYELHRPARVKNVRVTAGGIAKVDVALEPDEASVEEVTAVEAEVERASAATQLFLRKNAAQASDSIGAQDIAKTPDRNAADAVKRVVGATVVDGRYIFVRGLGDRYTNSLLNGSPLPSPEPDRQAVPLDMFPTLVLSDLTVSKTFTPNMPGDFAGGSLDIHTRDLPQKFLFQGTLGLGVNSESTFGRRLGYPGGKWDFLGMDDGSRKLPSVVPRDRVTRLRPDGTVNPDVASIGKAVNGPMETERVFDLPNGSGSVVVGDSFKLGGQRVLGYVAGASYSRKFQKRNDEIIRTYGVDPNKPNRGDGGAEAPQSLVRFNDYRAETGIDTVTWSTLGTVSYAFDNDHKVALTGLYSRNAEKEGRLITGFNEEQNNDVRDERLRFVNRALTYAQLRGEHRFRSLNAAQLTWAGLWSRATLADPDLRETVYVNDPQTGYSYRESTQSGQHFYAAQGETTRSVGLDWLQPLGKGDKPTAIKAGTLATLRGRSFNARRFRFLRNPRATDAAAFRQSPNALFTDDNVGTLLELEEWTRPTDSYAARYNVLAGYVMADVAVLPRLRVVVGERLESAKQTIDSFDPFSPETKIQSRLARTDLLPSANAIVKVTETSNVRLSATRTVARPQLRELAPFIFSDFLGAREVLGNPDLDRTQITNLDARFEIFPRVSEVLAVSFFHKRFEKPIEPFIIPTSRGVLSFQNAKGAVNTGVELEARKSLDFVTTAAKDFSVLANLTLVHSEVQLDEAAGGIQTSKERPLAGQSPYVVNFALDWANDPTKIRARALYNVQGARVAQVGQNGLPDTYEQPRHLVDLSVAKGFGEHVDTKLTLENVFDAPVKFTQGRDDTFLANRYLTGRTLWVSATYTY